MQGLRLSCVQGNHASRHPYVVIATAVSAASQVTLQAYMVGPSGVLRKALFSRGVAARLVAVRGLLYMIIQQLRTMDEGEAEDAMEADPELSCSQVHFNFCISAIVKSGFMYCKPSCSTWLSGEPYNTVEADSKKSADITCNLTVHVYSIERGGTATTAVSLHCGMCPVNPTQPYLLSGCLWSLPARLQLTFLSYPGRMISQLQN